MALFGAVAVIIGVLASTLAMGSAHASTVPKLIFGMGDEIAGAEATPLYNDAPVNMVTSWYNDSGDLSWMNGYRGTNQIEQIYAEGKANELVVDLNSDPSYAVSAQFQTDIASLTSIFKGNGPVYGPLYIVLFTEFDTYEPGNSAYTSQLLSAYINAVGVIHGVDPQAKVALGLGGYNWSSSPTATTDLGPETAAIDDSDFVAVQAMQDCQNEGQLENEVHASIAQLSTFHKPIMISYMKLWQSNVDCATSAMSTFEAHIFNDATLTTLTAEGLFAWGFMDDTYITTPGPALNTAIADVVRYSSGTDVAEPAWGATGRLSNQAPCSGQCNYWLTGSDGGVFAFGAPFYGSTGALHLAQPIVGMASTPDGRGYWFVARDGGVFSFGNAGFAGSVPGVATVDDVVGMAASSRGGYWVAAADGTTYAFGHAPALPSLSSLGVHIDNVIGLASTADGGGCWLVASDGGVYALGDAVFHGSMGGRSLNRPIVGMAADQATGGYWLVASDGGIFAVDAPFRGSTGALTLDRPIVGMAATSGDGGYWLVASDGGLFAFGNARFNGSLPSIGVTPVSPVVGMTAP